MPPYLHSWNGEKAHVGQWRQLEGFAVIAPTPGEACPTVDFVEHCCRMLTERGFRHVVTPALPPHELIPFMQAGFVEREQLDVLTHDLCNIPTQSAPGYASFRRGRSGDVGVVLDIDGAAFDTFWRFDLPAFREACSATPQSRFRVAIANAALPATRPHDAHALSPVLGHEIVGYCVTGRTRTQGFLQRLAVAPAAQGLGIGRTLVIDALEWLFRRRAMSCVVNTQESNRRATLLYLACGFEMAPPALHVLTRSLRQDALR